VYNTRPKPYEELGVMGTADAGTTHQNLTQFLAVLSTPNITLFVWVLKKKKNGNLP